MTTSAMRLMALAGGLVATIATVPAAAQQVPAAPQAAPAAAAPAGQNPQVLANVDHKGDLRTLVLGTPAAELDTEGYFEYACGSNGSPPLKKLTGWTDYAQCTPDERGLHEVYYEYDNQGEFTAQLLTELVGANEIPTQKLYGTRIFGQPVVLSVLFDDDGIARGIRAVTDSRVAFELRRAAYILRVPILRTYDQADWQCTDLPLAEGEAPLGNTYYKQRCEAKTAPDRYIYLNSDLFRRPGEQGFTRGGEGAQGEFWSETRWEVWQASFIGK